MKKTHLFTLLAAASVTGLTTYANAAVVVGYTSTAGATAPATTTGAGVTPAALARGSGIAAASGGTFNSNGFDIDNATAAAAIADNDFLTFGFDSTTAYDLTDLDIRYDRSNTGPNQIVIQIDTGGGFTTFYTDTDVNANGETVLDIDLSAFTNVTSADFRIVGFGATSTGGTFDPENDLAINNGESIVVNGDVATVIPEPASIALLGLGGVTLLARRRRSA